MTLLGAYSGHGLLATEDGLRVIAGGAVGDMPTFQAAGTAAGGIGAVAPEWPTHETGDIGILFVETTNTDGNVAAPTDWTEVTGSPQGAGTTGSQIAVFWKRAASAAESAPTVADVGDHQYAVILTARGCVASGSPINASAGGVVDPNTTTAIIPGATTTMGNCLVFAVASHGYDNRAGMPFFSAWANADLSDVTERFDDSTNEGDGGGFGVATGGKAAAGAYGDTTATAALTARMGCVSLALRPV